MKAILAMARNGAIGKDGGLPWPSLSEDLRFFRDYTMCNTVIVGRKTFETLPFLRERHPIIVTRSGVATMSFLGSLQRWNEKDVFPYIYDDVKKVVKKFSDSVVIGGRQIYIAFLPYCEELMVTYIKESYQGDVYCPPINPEDSVISFYGTFVKDQVIKDTEKFSIIKYKNRNVQTL